MAKHKRYHSLYWQLGVSIALLLIIIEGVLLVTSINHKKLEIKKRNADIGQAIEDKYQITNVEIYSEEEVERIIEKVSTQYYIAYYSHCSFCCGRIFISLSFDCRKKYSTNYKI